LSLISELLSWIARVASVATAALVIAFAVGEPFHWEKVTPVQIVGLILLGAGVMALLAAWRWPLAGACGALAALTAFTVLEYSRNGRFPGPWFAVFLGLPALMYLLGWLSARGRGIGS
jgi:hypothetical protein